MWSSQSACISIAPPPSAVGFLLDSMHIAGAWRANGMYSLGIVCRIDSGKMSLGEMHTHILMMVVNREKNAGVFCFKEPWVVCFAWDTIGICMEFILSW